MQYDGFADDIYTKDAMRVRYPEELAHLSTDKHGRITFRTASGDLLRFFQYDGKLYCIDNGTTYKPPRDQLPLDPHPAYIED